MIIKPDLVKKIRSFFNLNIYETKVWLALIAKGIASAGEIAELSGVPRSRTYDVLESLEKQGFAMVKIGKPVKYIAVKPTTIIEKLKRNASHEAEEKIKTLASLKDTKEYEELETLHKSGLKPISQEKISTAVRGKFNLYSHIREMLESAEKETIVCLPAQELLEKSRVFNSLFDRLRKRGIKVRVALNGNQEEFKKVEEKYKIKPEKINIDARFFIMDNKEVLIIISSPNEEELGIWFNSELFASTLSYLFDQAAGK